MPFLSTVSFCPSFHISKSHLWGGLFISGELNVNHVCGIAMRPEMITQTIWRKEFFCVADVLVIGKCNSQSILVCNWRSQKGPCRGAQIAQNTSCQKAVSNKCPVELKYYFPNNKNLRVVILAHFPDSSLSSSASGSRSDAPTPVTIQPSQEATNKACLCAQASVRHSEIHLQSFRQPD